MQMYQRVNSSIERFPLPVSSPLSITNVTSNTSRQLPKLFPAYILFTTRDISHSLPNLTRRSSEAIMLKSPHSTQMPPHLSSPSASLLSTQLGHPVQGLQARKGGDVTPVHATTKSEEMKRAKVSLESVPYPNMLPAVT